MANRETQIARKVLQAGGNPNARETQIARKVLQVGGTPNARNTQIARKVLVQLSLPPNPGKKPQPVVFVVT